MTSEEKSDITYRTMLPDAGRKAIRAGVSQAPPEELRHEFSSGGTHESGEDYPEGYNANQSAPGGTLVTAADFANQDEDMGRPLLGQEGDMLLSAGGTLFMYGKGGAGKTTLTLDAICHLASGTPWLGLPVPTPLRIILIENEGPRALLRRRVRDKIDTWEGESWAERVWIWTDPWMGFTFRQECYRQQIAGWVTEYQSDLVVVGPLAAIGAIGGGTPDEVSEFGALLEDVRRRTDTPVAFWIVHHENKAGDVSGAWDRLPDTLVHVSAQGNGHTRFHVQKGRWSTLHDTALNLSWNGTRSFQIDEDKQPVDENELMTRIRVLFEEQDEWRISEEIRAVVGGNRTKLRSALDQLTEGGVLTEQKGPPGRNASARCWRLASGWTLPILGEPGHESTQGHPGSPTGTGGSGGGGEPGAPLPVREGHLSGSPTPPPEATQYASLSSNDQPTKPAPPTPAYDDDIPF